VPDVPVLLGDEALDLALAVHDEAERYGLHAPGRQAERELGPHERGDVVADDAVEHAAGPLRVVEVVVELAWIRHAVRHAALRDLVELDPRDVLLGLLDLVGDVPRDRLALAIGVGREQDAVDLLRGGLQLRDDLLLALDDLVLLGEVVRDVDGARALGEVLDVALGRQHLVPGPRYFLIVFALAGDSTMRRVLAIAIGSSEGRAWIFGVSSDRGTSVEAGGGLYYYGLQGERQERRGHGRKRERRPVAQIIDVDGRFADRFEDAGCLRRERVRRVRLRGGRM
jgi:hypothetical protein